MKRALSILTILFFFGVSSAQNAYDEPADVPHRYFELSLKLIKETSGFTPPVASRALGYTSLCLYESVVHGMPNYTSLAGNLPELNSLPLPENGQYNWSVVANNALSTIIDSLYINMSLDNKVALYAARNTFNAAYQTQLPVDVFDRSKSYGEQLGLAIFDYSKTESGHRGQFANFPSSYVPPVGEAYWSPLTNQAALQPYWGNNRAFMPVNVTTGALPPPPPSFGTDPNSIFYAYANQVYSTSLSLTQDQKDIASFWADGGGTFTPPGHSVSMLRQILKDEGWNLGRSSVAYVKMGLSLSDAFLACWKTKYIYNLCRPITYIRNNIDPNWTSFIGTPPFPEYPSGHSSQSGAWYVVMTHLFGNNYAFTDSTYNATLGLRSFTDFESCAEETAISRLYGGIHYDFGNKNGSYLGKTVGENIINLFQQVSSTKERLAIPSVYLFPNPAKQAVYIKYPTSEMKFASIYSLTGNLVKTIAMEGNSIELGSIASGLYQIVIMGDDNRILGQQRIVVQP